MRTVQELATAALNRDPSIELIEFDRKWITIGQMHALAQSVNALIDASGAHALAPIAFVPRNRPEVLTAMVGLAARGRYVRMIHPYQSQAGLARDLARLGPAVLVAVGQDFGEEVLAALKEQGVAGIALEASMTASAVDGCERSTGACAPSPAVPQFDLLTSGTTGPPKQFPITYDFIASEMVGHSTLSLGDGPDPLDLAPAHLYWPFGNFSGLYSTLTPMLQGMRGVLADRFRVEQFHDYLVRFRPDWIGLPPAGVQMILDADLPIEDFNPVTFARVGSAPLPVASHREFEDRYGIPILQAYGATEFGGPVTVMPLEIYPEWGRKKLGSVGLPYKGAQLRAVDPVSGEILAPGKEGLLEVIAPRMGEDWIRTSDLGIVDEDGFVWHRGRADGAIMRGGFKLLPEVIEEALDLHDCVAAAMVTGIPDRRLGQVPAAAILLKPNANELGIDELEAHLRQHVEATHIPAKWRFVDALPYNGMMKPDRIALRKVFEGDHRT